MSSDPRYKIRWTQAAVAHVDDIADPRAKRVIVQRIEQLARAPEQQGSALLGELGRYRSVRALGQRYRIVYQVDRRDTAVVIVAVGRRKAGDSYDIYRLAEKLIKQVSGAPQSSPVSRSRAGISILDRGKSRER